MFKNIECKNIFSAFQRVVVLRCRHRLAGREAQDAQYFVGDVVTLL